MKVYSKEIKKAVILAGGRGERLAKLTENTPKPLIKIGKKSVIEHQITLLKRYGVKEIWILLGYLGDQIKRHLKTGKKWGVNIYYCQEEKPLGTAGAIKQLENKIKEDFLVFSGDVMLDFDVKRFTIWHKNRKPKSIASFLVHPNDHPFDSDLVEADKTGRVTALLRRPHSEGKIYRNLSIASAYIFSPRVFKYIPSQQKTDIEKDLLPALLKAKENVFAYNTPEYIKDMGTPERLMKVRKDYAAGKIRRLNLRNKRKAAFLDRDGVINEEIDQLAQVKDFKIYNFAAKAIKRINDAEFLAIIVTNQPMIAKGFMTENDLENIHKKMETELGKAGAKIDAIYYCPHHPERGFAGEVPELKIKCQCRKPGIGLIKKAAKDFNLDLSQSFFIGNSSRDAKAAENAKIKFIGVKTGYGCRDGRYQIKKKFPLYKNLLEAVEKIGKRLN